MPAPPVFQPEVAADAVHWAARHRRRQVYVGLPTFYTVLGSKLAPWLAERYLARTAVSGQQAEGPPDPHNDPGNLMQPPPEDPGAHGPFDEISHNHSPTWFLSRHRTAAGAALAASAATAAGLLAANR
jgi:hypothetical protein